MDSYAFLRQVLLENGLYTKKHADCFGNHRAALTLYFLERVTIYVQRGLSQPPFYLYSLSGGLGQKEGSKTDDSHHSVVTSRNRIP